MLETWSVHGISVLNRRTDRLAGFHAHVRESQGTPSSVSAEAHRDSTGQNWAEGRRHHAALYIITRPAGSIHWGDCGCQETAGMPKPGLTIVSQPYPYYPALHKFSVEKKLL